MGLQSIDWSEDSFRTFDAAVIATAHRGVNYQQLVEWVACIIDIREALAGVAVRPGQLLN
jgi:UDP-N-acetyl-D-mannosaminuronate dehydrogenase